MSTQDIPDNELDDFFRKSLEEPDIEFREEDWLQMEKKLDTANRKRAIFRKFLYSLLVIILLGTTVAVIWRYYTNQDNIAAISTDSDSNAKGPYSPNNSESTDKNTFNGMNSDPKPIENESITSTETSAGTVATQNTPIAEDKVSQKDNFSQESKIKEPTQVKEKSSISNKSKEDKGKQSKESILTGPGQQEKTTATRLPAIRNREPIGTGYSVDNKRNTTETEGKKISTKSRKTPALKTTAGNTLVYSRNKPSTKKPETDNIPIVEGPGESVAKDRPSSNPSQEYVGTEITEGEWPIPSLPRLSVVQKFMGGKRLSDKYADKINNTLPDKPDYELPGDSIDVTKLAKERINYRFSLGLVLSPDLSAVKFSDLTKPGTNIGLVLSYRFSPKVSIMTGLIRSAKIYDARTEDYHPPSGQWIYYVKPVEIKASCTVLDIPVNIRYNLLARKNYTIYAVTGLSSYLMLSEYYKYVYDVDDSHLRKYWQVKNKNKHFFKVYNISAGYERKLGKRFSAGAEPFLKIPGAGVGFGKIQLWTAGIFVSANYQFGK